MSRTAKNFLIGLASLVVVVVRLGAGFGYKVYSEISIVAPLPTGRVVDDVYAIRTDFVNLFAIDGEEGIVVIDAGNDLEQARKGYGDLGLDRAEVRAVFLTIIAEGKKMFESSQIAPEY